MSRQKPNVPMFRVQSNLHVGEINPFSFLFSLVMSMTGKHKLPLNVLLSTYLGNSV